MENLSRALLCLVSTLLSAPDVVPLVQRNTEPSPRRSLFFPLVPFLFFKKNIMCINKMLKEMKVKWQEGFFFFFWLLGFVFLVCVFYIASFSPSEWGGEVMHTGALSSLHPESRCRLLPDGAE